jgi:hypothetical protein
MIINKTTIEPNERKSKEERQKYDLQEIVLEIPNEKFGDLPEILSVILLEIALDILSHLCSLVFQEPGRFLKDKATKVRENVPKNIAIDHIVKYPLTFALDSIRSHPTHPPRLFVWDG